MRWSFAVIGLLIFLLITAPLSEAKEDLYKILGVEKNASQRDIQKAFHKLSLKYHPDKNKSKNAQAKFSEINNAYEILSDEEKRKNYDTYGNEQGNSRFEGGGPGYGSSHFNFGGQNSEHSTFRQGRSQGRSGRESFQHFTFPSQEYSGGSNSFTFDFGGSEFMGDILSNFFGSGKSGQGNGNPFASFSGSQGGAKSGFGNNQASQYSHQIQVLDAKNFKKKVTDQGLTWLLIFYSPSSKGYQELEGILDQIANSFQGVVKVGAINCQIQQKLCKDQNAWPQKTPKLYVYSIRSNGKGSMIEYTGEWNVKDVKNYCLDLLPRFSKRIDSNDINDLLKASQKLPRVLLLTTKKQTPAIWRVLSGLYYNRVLFYDVEVADASHPIARKFGVKALPAMIGILSNGEVLVLASGSGFEKLGSQKVEELGKLIENLQKRNLEVSNSKTNGQSNQGAKGYISTLTKENEDMLCGEDTPLCMFGVFGSSRGKEKVETVLKAVSQKTLTRGGKQFDEVKDPISYSIVDAAKQKAFLLAFDKAGFKGMDAFLVAYKPRKGRSTIYKGPLTIEDAERFISGVLNGDVQFTKVLRKPELS